METSEQTIRIQYDKMKSEFSRILLSIGFSEQNAEKCAEIFTMNSLEGVNSHGINRFQRFVNNTLDGYVKPEAVPSLVHRVGSIEQWNGNLGPGPLNATFAAERAMELAIENGIGMVTLANTNHWMRGGTYGWQAAKKGFVIICWTNTCPNMPAGYWKGAGMSLLLDILATILSGGLATHQIRTCSSEYSVSQVFIAINLKSLINFPAINNSILQIIEDLHKSTPENPSVKIRYPGENILQIRNENLKNGIPVNTAIWGKILNFSPPTPLKGG